MLDSYADVFGTDTISGQETASVRRYADRQPSRTISEAEEDDNRIDIEVHIGTQIISAPSVPKELEPRVRAIAEKLEELTRLEAGWDSYSAVPIRERAIGDAFTIALYMLPRVAGVPYVGPLKGGGVELDWRVRDKEAEVELEGGRSSVFLAEPGFEREFPDISVTATRSLLSGWLE